MRLWAVGRLSSYLLHRYVRNDVKWVCGYDIVPWLLGAHMILCLLTQIPQTQCVIETLKQHVIVKIIAILSRFADI